MILADYLNIAQALGILAFMVEIISFSMKNDNRQIILRIVSSFIWMLHYHGLGKWVPAIIVAVDFLRYGSAMYVRARPALIYPALALFALVYLSIGFYFKTTWLDLLPAATSILSSFAIFALRDIPMRVAFLGVMSSWLIYDFSIHSVGSVINNALMLAMNGITMYRMMRNQKATHEQ